MKKLGRVILWAVMIVLLVILVVALYTSYKGQVLVPTAGILAFVGVLAGLQGHVRMAVVELALSQLAVIVWIIITFVPWPFQR